MRIWKNLRHFSIARPSTLRLRLTAGFCFGLVSVTALPVVAQIDPSSALLLNGGGGASSRDNGLDSGRYTVRPRSEIPRRSSDDGGSRLRTKGDKTPPDKPADKPADKVAAEDENASPTKPVHDSTVSREQSAAPTAVVTGPAASPIAGPIPEAGNSATPPLAVGVAPARSAVGTGAAMATPSADLNSTAPQASTRTAVTPAPAASNLTGPAQATAQAPPQFAPLIDQASRPEGRHCEREANRKLPNHLLDISLATGYLYNDSQSTYSFRRYVSSSPSLSADIKLWLSPQFSLAFSYLSSLSASVSDGSDPARTVAVTQQYLTAGIRYRDFFSGDLNNPYLIWGADYSQYQMDVPADAESRASLQSTGAKLSVLGVFPMRGSYSWNLGFALLPKLYHHESINNAGFESGSHPDANAVEFTLGGQWAMSSSNAMFWRLSYQVEKDLFSGAASVVDPSNTTTPNGVSVTNTTAILQMGYTWGN